MFIRQFFLFILLLFGLASFAQAQQDPFKKTRPSTEQQAPNLRKKLQQLVLMPPWFRSWQRSVQAKVSETALKIKERPWQESWRLYVFGFVLSIVFGFLHIAGPGHGKIFTISYFMSRRGSLREGLAMSAMINIVDSLSAGLVVFIAYGALTLTLGQKSWVETIISIVSYSIILLWGLWHLGQHLFGHAGGHCAGHKTHKKKPTWYFALGIGLVPCPISTGLLIFGLLNQILGLAIFLVVGVSLGGMVAMSLLSFAVIGGKKGFLGLLFSAHDKESKMLGRAGTLVEFLALGLMILVAGVFLLLSLPS